MWSFEDTLIRPDAHELARISPGAGQHPDRPTIALLTFPALGAHEDHALADALERLPSAVLPEEEARCDDWGHPGTRLAHLAGRTLARWALFRDTGVDAAAWRIQRAADGAPIAVGPRDAPIRQVSIAHTDTAAVAVVSRTPVGADLERVGRPVSWDRLAPRVFPHPAERERIGALPGADRDRALRVRWVVLEATAKASRLGLARLLHRRPRVVGSAEDWCVSVDGASDERYRVRTTVVTPEALLVAVAESREDGPADPVERLG